MIFSSPVFICFFALYYALHFAVPENWKLFLLILGSTIFYGYWNPIYTWVPYLLIAIGYFGALWIEQGKDSFIVQRKGKALCVIIALSLPLLIFKYSNFLYQNLIDSNTQIFNLTLPLGISFITFSLIAYVVEVYKRNYPLEKDLTQFTAYTLFFPHLIAGPILRPKELLPQLVRLKTGIQKDQAIFGVALFSVGLLKKLVFADTIASSVDAVYNTSVMLGAWDYLLAIYGFSIQIYCDFSGYTDMALGIAIFFGIVLPNNFDCPYLANSIIDFWRRWHITLSQWLRDYIYIPLGGNRKGFIPQMRNVFFTMLLGGLWHGANWTFILWGAGHGILIALNHLIKKWAIFSVVERIPTVIKIIFTFHLVTILWVLFRAQDFTTFCYILKGPFNGDYSAWLSFGQKNTFSLLLLMLFFIFQKFDNHRWIACFAKGRAKGIFWPSIIFIWLAAITISMGSSAKFVYFDF